MGYLYYVFGYHFVGILYIILILVGIFLASNSVASLNSEHTLSKQHGGMSIRITGFILVAIGILGFIVSFVLSKHEITSDQYTQVKIEAKKYPELDPFIQNKLATKPHLDQIDFIDIQTRYNDLSKQDSKADLTKV